MGRRPAPSRGLRVALRPFFAAIPGGLRVGETMQVDDV
jgi:hypothetical protein